MLLLPRTFLSLLLIFMTKGNEIYSVNLLWFRFGFCTLGFRNRLPSKKIALCSGGVLACNFNYRLLRENLTGDAPAVGNTSAVKDA
jgi:hypothetical protein